MSIGRFVDPVLDLEKIVSAFYTFRRLISLIPNESFLKVCRFPDSLRNRKGITFVISVQAILGSFIHLIDKMHIIFPN